MPRCPSCNKLMTHVTQENVRLNTCPECFGTWISKTALVRLTRVPMVPPADGSPEPTLQELAAIVVESNTKERLHCPECPLDLIKERYHPLIPVEVDRCKRCNNIWLDVGELPLLRRLFAELTTSTDPQVVALREKVAGTALALEQMDERIRDMREASRPQRGARAFGAIDTATYTLDFLMSMLTR